MMYDYLWRDVYVIFGTIKFFNSLIVLWLKILFIFFYYTLFFLINGNSWYFKKLRKALRSLLLITTSAIRTIKSDNVSSTSFFCSRTYLHRSYVRIISFKIMALHFYYNLSRKIKAIIISPQNNETERHNWLSRLKQNFKPSDSPISY